VTDFGKVVYPVNRTINIYKNGIQTSAPHHMEGKGLPDHLKDKKRGEIVGWSSGSRKRLREWLVSHQPISGNDLYGVTLTIPGEPPLPAEKEKLFKSFREKTTYQDIGNVWRHEVQRRGSSHWHLLTSAPAGNIFKVGRVAGYPFEVFCRLAWLDSLRELPDAWQRTKNKAGEIIGESFGNRANMYGAFQHSCDVEKDSGGLAWLRYLLDHTSKLKQEQVAETGRAWGVSHKSGFQEVEPVLSEVSYAAFVTLHRVLRKWSRPTIRDNERTKKPSVFGWRHGYETRRGSKGSSVWFGAVPALTRAVSYAVAYPATIGLEKPYAVLSSGLSSRAAVGLSD